QIIGGERAPGRGRCAPRRQSLLRSYLAPRSFPRRPPAESGADFHHPISGRAICLPPAMLVTLEGLIAQEESRAARPHAGGGGGKECAARHERSNDWPQGGRRPP